MGIAGKDLFPFVYGFVNDFKVFIRQEKRFFFMDIFLKEKFAPMSSQPTNELNEHVCHKERKFVGGCILSVL